MPVLSLAEFARHRGVSRNAVSLAAKSGRITRRPDGKVDQKTADREWEQNTDATKPRSSVRAGRGSGGNGGSPPGGRRPPGPKDPPAEPKARSHVPRTLAEALFLKEKARAMKADLDLQVAQGKLVYAADVSAAVFEVNRRARDLLLGLPVQLANTLAGVSDPDVCLRHLIRAVDDVCAALAAPPSIRRRRDSRKRKP